MGNKKKHIPVLLQEVIHSTKVQQGDKVIDATIGFGGHAEAFLERISPSGKMIGMDLDEEALSYVKENLKPKYPNLTLIKGNFSEIDRLKWFGEADIILADIGISSHQVDSENRGFSFRRDEELDMRMDKENPFSAKELVNEYSKDRLTEIFKKYGEERMAGKIAQDIVKMRQDEEILTTGQLAKIIRDIYPKGKHRIDPATKVFQAIRIEVNGELKNLERFIPKAIDILDRGGRLAVITFHSLEDRVVKKQFINEEKDCICPPESPICRCNKKKRVKILTKKPIKPNKEEIVKNPRSRSAKLRIVEKI